MLKEIQELAEKLGDVEAVKAELKRVQSVKCRLKKQKAREDYESEMTKVVAYEQALKEVRDYFEPKGTPVTQMTKDDIEKLNYDETMKAIKSIQSKKCNSQYLTERIDENIEYKKACEIEALLLEHKKTVKPIEDTVIKKSAVHNLIAHVETLQPEVKKEYVLKLLNGLLTVEIDDTDE